MPDISSIAVSAVGVVLRTAEDAPTGRPYLGACPWTVAEFMSLFFQCSG
jgi:hypothetical protein